LHEIESVSYFHLNLHFNSLVVKTFFLETKTKTKTLAFETKTKTKTLAFKTKTKTKTLTFKTKTKTLAFESRDQDQDLGLETKTKTLRDLHTIAKSKCIRYRHAKYYSTGDTSKANRLVTNINNMIDQLFRAINFVYKITTTYIVILNLLRVKSVNFYLF